MCKTPQYIQRKDINLLLVNGYDTLLADKETYIIKHNMLKQTKQGLQIKVLNLIEYYFRVDNPEVIVKHSKARDVRFKWLRKYRINPTEIELLNSATGESLPLYLEVSCGQCDECLQTRSNKISTKVRCQSITEGIPYFITLTINNQNYSKFDQYFKGSNGLCFNKLCYETIRKEYHNSRVREIQLFLKRLRKNLTDDNILTPLTYIITSERGSKTNRIHFHGLIWCDDRELKELRDYEITDIYGKIRTITATKLYEYVRDAWQNGFVTVATALDDEGNYALKYSTKQDSWRENLLLKSRLGKNFISQEFEYLHDNPQLTKFDALNPFSNEMKEITLDSWFVSKLYPNINRSINHRTRYLITYVSNILRKFSYTNEVQYYKEKFSEELKELVEYGYIDLAYTDKHYHLIDKIHQKRLFQYGLREYRQIRYYEQALHCLRKAMRQLSNELSKLNLEQVVDNDVRYNIHKEKLEKVMQDADRIHKVQKVKQRIQRYKENECDNQ